MTDNPSPAALRDLAVEVAADIAEFLRIEVAGDHAPDTKSSRTDFVTAVDRASEARVVEAISGAWPHDGFKGEEGTDTPGSSGVRWIIDPIDGTTNFVFAHPGFSVSIAAELDGTVVAVTHDRYFLDNVAGWILELDRGHGIPWEGNYSSWLEQKEKRLAQEEREQAAHKKTIAAELEWVRSNPKGRQAKSRARVQRFE